MYTIYIIFRQNFSDKKNLSPFQKNFLAETIHYINLLLNFHIYHYFVLVRYFAYKNFKISYIFFANYKNEIILFYF